MQNPQDRILAFEYVLSQLLEWQMEEKSEGENDLSILKSLKLLFFVSASQSKSNENSILIDEVFNKFVAMPYGHVESVVYTYICENDGNLNYYKIDNRKTTLKDQEDISQLKDLIGKALVKEIDKSINFLKIVNPRLILMSAFELVDLSHAWYSWQLSYNNAKLLRLKSAPIEPSLIKNEDKIFSL